MRNISMAEVITTRAQSLLSKFTQDSNNSSTDVHGFVSDLLEQPEVNIIGAARAPLGVIIHRLFIAAHKVCISCVPVCQSCHKQTLLSFFRINLLFHVLLMSSVTLSSLSTFVFHLRVFHFQLESYLLYILSLCQLNAFLPRCI